MAQPFNLAALLKDVSEPDTGREQIEYISLDLIDSDPNNFYQLTEIDKLADNISLCGLQQPIRVRQQEDGRYMIVSGHRRRAALEMLVADGYEQFREVSCIVERDEVSPALQQLRLIFANSNTRKMSDAEISEQSARVEKLLYQLKENEGYEFPGRMRDHVSEIVGISKSKLARLKVIREKLSHVWSASWKKGKLNESVAYELSKLPEKWQQTIYRARGENAYLDVKYIKAFGERFHKIAELKCKKNPGHVLCHNAEFKQMRVASDSPYSVFYCDKCCAKCPELSSCKYVCPVHASKAQALRADKRAARKLEIAAEREADRPEVEKIEAIWNRFGTERVSAGCSVKAVKEAMGLHYWNDEQAKYEKLENGTAKISSGTKLPFGSYLSDASNLIALADLFGCSVDYLLCRTDIKEMAQLGGAVSESDTRWKNSDPWNFGEYVVLVRYNSTKPPVPKIMSWTEDGWVIFGSSLDEIFPDAIIVGWVPMPEEDEVAFQNDETLASAMAVIRETGVASVSMLQRKLKLGYAAASALMEQMEKTGAVGPYNGSKPREILMDLEVKNK